MQEFTKAEVLKISYKPSARSYFILLKELEGKNIISLSIESFEAQIIALALESIDQTRPMTHDLICSLFYETGFNLKSVQITESENGVLNAMLDLELRKVERIKIDSRPSDAIIIALKKNAPILVSRKLMANPNVQKITFSKSINKNHEKFFLKTLKSKLESAVRNERYREAAKLRDKIKEIEG